MRFSRLIAAALTPLIVVLVSTGAPAQQPSGAVAQAAAPAPAAASSPTPAQVKSAVKTALMSVDLTLPQKRQIRTMVQNYEAQTANADGPTKKAAQKALLENIYGILTPAQQTQFKASIKQSLGADTM